MSNAGSLLPDSIQSSNPPSNSAISPRDMNASFSNRKRPSGNLSEGIPCNTSFEQNLPPLSSISQPPNLAQSVETITGFPQEQEINNIMTTSLNQNQSPITSTNDSMQNSMQDSQITVPPPYEAVTTINQQNSNETAISQTPSQTGINTSNPSSVHPVNIEVTRQFQHNNLNFGFNNSAFNSFQPFNALDQLFDTFDTNVYDEGTERFLARV